MGPRRLHICENPLSVKSKMGDGAYWTYLKRVSDCASALKSGIKLPCVGEAGIVSKAEIDWRDGRTASSCNASGRICVCVCVCVRLSVMLY